MMRMVKKILTGAAYGMVGMSVLLGLVLGIGFAINLFGIYGLIAIFLAIGAVWGACEAAEKAWNDEETDETN